MEPITTYYLATRDPLVRQRLIELIFIESNTILQKSIGACADRHTLDWKPVQDPKFYRASYGHDLENIWLLVEACNAAAIPNGPMMDLYRTLFDYALKYGFDEKEGGVFYTGPFNKPAEDRTKSWWVQAEALVSALRMYQLTGDRIYFDCFTKTLDWVVKHQVDWKNGDWFSDIRPDGTPSGMKAGPWKAAYHNGRAMLECLVTLDVMLRP
jgi:mannobiose 2-epimerase